MKIAKTKKSETRSNRAIEYIYGLLAGIVAGLITAILAVVYNLPDIIALPVAVVLAVVVWWLMKKYPMQVSNAAWITFLIIGIGLLLSSYQQALWSGVVWRLDVAGLGIGIISVSIASLAMNISLNSDKKVTAIADMQFYDKMAVIQTYLMKISPEDSDEYNRAYADRIFYDLKAAKQLEKWVSSPEIAKMLDGEIQNLMDKTLSGQKYEHLVKRLQQVKEGDC
ncbi:hypothetical protein ES704_02182 [subsurface metagenome]|jgi:hypothetical protein